MVTFVLVCRAELVGFGILRQGSAGSVVRLGSPVFLKRVSITRDTDMNDNEEIHVIDASLESP